MNEFIYLTCEDVHCIGEALNIKNIKRCEQYLTEIMDDSQKSPELEVFTVAGNYMVSLSRLQGVEHKKQLAFLSAMVFLMMNDYAIPASPELVRLTEFASQKNSSLQEVAFCLRFLCFS